MCKVKHCLDDDALATQAMSKFVERTLRSSCFLSIFFFLFFFKALSDSAGATLIVGFLVCQRNATTRRAPSLRLGDYVDMLGFPSDRIVRSPTRCEGHYRVKLLTSSPSDNGLLGGLVTGDAFNTTFNTPSSTIIGLIVAIYEGELPP